MAMILPGSTGETRPATKPFPGVDAAVVEKQGRGGRPRWRRLSSCDGRGHHAPRDLQGLLKRFVETYWSRFDGMYFAGDGARIDEDGDFWLMGRVDDVADSGHRISTIEVESALVDHPKVAEAAVCGIRTRPPARPSSRS